MVATGGHVKEWVGVSLTDTHTHFHTFRPPRFLCSTGPTLDHQAAGEKERELTLSTADNVVRQERDALKKKMKKINKSGMGFEVGMWVEALKKGKRPYLMAKVTRVGKKGNEVDLEFEDGGKEKGVRTSNGRVKATKVGSRAATSSGAHGKLTYASKRDAYHGYDVGEEHNKTIEKVSSAGQPENGDWRLATVLNEDTSTYRHPVVFISSTLATHPHTPLLVIVQQ